MVSIEYAIVANNGEVLGLRLGNQHPVEGVAMRSWKFTRPDGVLQGYWQSLESQLGEIMIEFADKGFAGWQLANAHFRCNLPGRSSTHQDFIVAIFNEAPRTRT